MGVDYTNLCCGFLHVWVLMPVNRMREIITRCVTCGIKAKFSLVLQLQGGASVTYYDKGMAL